MDDLYEAAGQGMETISADDMQIPFLRILQPLSPQLIKNDPKFIKGASAGDIFNTVTGEFWEADEGVNVLMCAYTTKFLEFQLRENGGGFMGELDANNPDIRQTNRVGANEMLPNGNELVRSAQFLVLAYDDNGMTTQMICDMKKTQMKIAKQWNTTSRWSEDHAPNQGSVQPTNVGCAVEADLDPRVQRQRFVVQLPSGSSLRWSPCQCQRCRKRVTCTIHTVPEKLK